MGFSRQEYWSGVPFPSPMHESDIAQHLPIRMEMLPNQSKWNPMNAQAESDSANKEGNESRFVQVLKDGCKILCSWHLNSNHREKKHKTALVCVCCAQFCLTLCDPMAGSLPGSSVHGIFQTRILEWGAIGLVLTGFLWGEWCWSWNSSTLATWCEELTHWKRLWCWEGLGAGEEGDDRGWDGDVILELMEMSLSELWELVMVIEVWCAAIHGVPKSRTLLSDWTELNWRLV